MALDAHVGCLLDPALEALGEEVLVAVNEVLSHHGLPLHCEPSSWEEIWSKHPNKRRRRRELGLRLGFYGSDRYRRFERVARHLAVRRRAPRGREDIDLVPNADYETAVRAGRGFEHAIAAAQMGSVIVPVELVDVLQLAQPRPKSPCLRLASAPAVRAQCRTVAFLLDPPHASKPRKARKLQEIATRLEEMGFELDRVAAPPNLWAEELEACSRLERLAADVQWSGAFAVVG